MTIQTKFNVKDKVFILQNGKITEATILEIKIEVFAFSTFMETNIPHISYEIKCHFGSFIKEENELFLTKEDLINNLK